MRVNVFGKAEHREIIELETDAVSLEIDDQDEVFRQPVHVTVSVNRTGNTAYLEGAVETDVLLECSRCLEQFSWRLSGDFTLVAKQLHDGESLRKSEADDEDDTSMVMLSYGENEVDITPYVRDALILALPMKPVCREDCTGLCPVCGKNITAGPCDCESGHKDTRWEALKGLLDGQSDEV